MSLPCPARGILIAGLAAAALAVTFCIPRFGQDPSYHSFADQRRLLDIPNMLDVVSNAGFVVVGILGMAFVFRAGGWYTRKWERPAFALMFAATAWVGAGSAYYHLSPNNSTLLWDRLPMAVVFMSLFAMVIADRVDMSVGKLLFLPLVAAGIGSVLYWRYTEGTGAGDLRFYALVQYFPLAAILVMLLFPSACTGTVDLIGVLAWYAVAKIAELLDKPIFEATEIVSGHTLKHLAAAAAAYWILRMIRRRRVAME